MVSPRVRPLIPAELSDCGGVTTRRELKAAGVSYSATAQQVEAKRWQRFGTAVVLANAPLSTWQQRRVAVLNCGPRAMLTSFTSSQEWGLKRWERPEIHVIAPAGTSRPPIAGLVLHRAGAWDRVSGNRHRRLQDLGQSLVIAASSFRSPRPAAGLFAAAVQQRFIRASTLYLAVESAPRTRHRRELLQALADISQGADALSEIDLGRLCRRFGLQQPVRQAVRVTSNGGRRYLDGEWEAADGRKVAIEVDGAYHLEASTWEADQLRQNEIVLGGTVVLRYPSFVVREQPELVAQQVRAALNPPRS